MPNLRIPITFLLIFSSIVLLNAQDSLRTKKIKVISDLQVGMIAGGQIANEEFVYKSGLIAQYSINTRLSPWLDAGLGIAFESLETEVIMPIFIDVKARLKDRSRTSMLGVNIGSSSGWSTYYRNFSDYEYSGGFYFSPYYTFQFPVSEKIDFLVATGYVHQLGHIEYFTDYDERYVESFAMDFLTIRAGLRF